MSMNTQSKVKHVSYAPLHMHKFLILEEGKTLQKNEIVYSKKKHQFGKEIIENKSLLRKEQKKHLLFSVDIVKQISAPG